VTRLAPDAPLIGALVRLLGQAGLPFPASEVFRLPLPSFREVYYFQFSGNGLAVVGKFLSAYPPASAADLSLGQEYHNYQQAAALGLTAGRFRIPRLLGRQPELRLGLLLEAVPGPDLDRLISGAAEQGGLPSLYQGLASLAELLAFWHSLPVPQAPVSSLEALKYLDKLKRQLRRQGVLTPEDEAALDEEGAAWEIRLAQFPERQVLVHGDATPTNFLFPNGGGQANQPGGGVVALDLERLRAADRLWDLSWVAGELKHAWAWRTANPAAAEVAISHFFRTYLAALPGDPQLTERLCLLNPFFMALAELRIARNAYLTWEHRRWLVAEARRCLTFGRRL